MKTTTNNKYNKNNKVKPLHRELIERMRASAHQRIVEGGMVEFHVDRKTMKLLQQAAQRKNIPLISMCRKWIVEQLKEEEKTLPANAGEKRNVVLNKSPLEILRLPVSNHFLAAAKRYKESTTW
jgi:hypothetical protein